MRGPRRNAPCPCGSGIQYKRCCRINQEPLDESFALPPGAPVRVITDGYAVHGRRRLASLLNRQPEVSGSLDQGWSRLDPASRLFEPLAALRFNAEGQLEVTTATQLAAETTRWWLERIAGKLVTHETGEAR